MWLTALYNLHHTPHTTHHTTHTMHMHSAQCTAHSTHHRHHTPHTTHHSQRTTHHTNTTHHTKKTAHWLTHYMPGTHTHRRRKCWSKTTRWQEWMLMEIRNTKQEDCEKYVLQAMWLHTTFMILLYQAVTSKSRKGYNSLSDIISVKSGRCTNIH